MVPMQATTTQPLSAPAAPPQAPAAPRTITVPGPGGTSQTIAVPLSRGEVREIVRQREEISSQLSNVSSRRRELASEIATASDGASRTGLEARLRVLDERILQLEGDLATTGRQLSFAAPELVSQAAGSTFFGDNFEAGFTIGGFGSALVLVPIAVLYARRRWKRKLGTSTPNTLGPESARLERLEQGMEAIAIEIERVAEGQRFVTKLMSESHVPVGAANRIAESHAVQHEDSTAR